MFVLHVLLIVFAFVTRIDCEDVLPRGVQIRLTEKGLRYAADVGIKIIQNDLKYKVINDQGKSGDFQYNIRNLEITKAEFPSYQLIPVPGVGIRGVMSGISIDAGGKLWYSYKKSWFIKISDTIGIDLQTRNINIDLTLNVGADETGHPTISVRSCNAGVNDIKVHFYSGVSWLYNLFSKIIENKLKDIFESLLCSVAIKQINTKVKTELSTFPVVKKIDRWAEIDYHLTQAPNFVTNYMDAYLKGEFKSSNKPVESGLRIPQFTPSHDHAKMLYFWMTDYTFNTACVVYHNEGRLRYTFAAWDKKISPMLKSVLSTIKFAILFPQITIIYPKRPMSVSLQSYRAPKVLISSGRLTLMLYVTGSFRVKDKNSIIHDAFTLQFDITTTVAVKVQDNNIAGKIIDFKYEATVEKTNVGKNIISLNSPFIKMILENTVTEKANSLLQKGFPLPKFDDISLENVDILFQENVIRIGSDIGYEKPDN